MNYIKPSNLKNIKQILLSFIFSYLSVLFLSANNTLIIQSGSDIIESFNNLKVVGLFLFVIFSILFSNSFYLTNKKTKKYSLVSSIVLGIALVIGNNLNQTTKILLSPFNKYSFLFFVICILGACSFLFICFSYFFYFINKMQFPNFHKNSLIFKTTPRKRFWLFVLIFLLSWSIYFIVFFPGIVTFDSFYQIQQGLFQVPLNDQHPFIHTLINGFMIKIGTIVFGNIFYGISFATLLQALFCACTFSYTISFMIKKNISTFFIYISIIFYAFFPLIALYSITLWKDIYMACFLQLYTILLTDISLDSNSFFNSKKSLSFLILIMLGILFSKGTGIIMITISFPFLIFTHRIHWKKLLTLSCVVFLIFGIIKGPVKSSLNIGPIKSQDILSLPAQQIARTVKYHDNELTQEEKQFISEIFPYEKLAGAYNPRISDTVKDLINLENLNDNKLYFVKNWAKLGTKYPVTFLESFLANSYGYWYPGTTYWIVGKGTTYPAFIEMYKENDWAVYDEYADEYSIAPWRDYLIKNIRQEMNQDNGIMRNIPVFSLFFNIGFYFWIAFIAFMTCLYLNQKHLLLPFTVIFAVFLSSILSPVHSEMRYAYAVVLILPMLIPFVLQKSTTLNNK